MTIRRIEPVSCAKIAGVLYAAIGVLVGGLIFLFGLFGSAFATMQRRTAGASFSPAAGMLIGLGAIIGLPIFYGAWVLSLR